VKGSLLGEPGEEVVEGGGGSANELQSLILDASDWEPGSEGDLSDLAGLASGYHRGGVIFDTPAIPTALWGSGSEVLAAIGEPTLVYSATGIGKTTLAQRIVLASIGIGPADTLGYPVRQIDGRVLYIAADRPSQAKRRTRRCFSGAFGMSHGEGGGGATKSRMWAAALRLMPNWVRPARPSSTAPGQTEPRIGPNDQ
jgi:hypothetical protein